MSRQVRKIEIYTHPVDGDSYLSEITEFDNQGNQTLQENYLPDGSLENKTESLYDSDNRLIEEKEYTDNGEFANQKRYIRNEKGEILKIEMTYQDGSSAVQTAILDPDTLIETVEEIDEDGELEFRELKQFNDKNQLISHDVFDFNEKLKEAFTYEYDDNGNLSLRKQFDHKRKLVLTTEYRYTEEGLMLYRANRNRKGKLSDFIIIDYDANGQVIKQNFSGKFFFVFEYDEKGNAVLEERYSANNEMEYQSRFEYDEHNQLVREISQEFTRELKYHYFEK